MPNLTKEEKVAFALMSLGKEAAAKILKQLSESEVRRINHAFSRVREISREDQLEVTREFQKLLQAGDTLVVDGEQFARDVLTQAFGEQKHQEIIGLGKQRSGSLQDLLSEISQIKFNNLIQTEHPQTATFFLAMAPANVAALALEELDEELQTDLMMRLSRIQSVKADITAELCEMLRGVLSSQVNEEDQIPGPEIAAKILGKLPRLHEERILSEINEIDESIAEQVRSLMFTFEDLRKISIRDMQKILQSIPQDLLVAALRTASPQLTDHIYASMTSRSAERLREDVQDQGKLKRKDVESAQQTIIDVALRLEADGTIVVSSDDGGEDWV